MRDFIDKHAPDLLLLQETHLRPKHSFSIPNYICYRNDRPNSAHGWGGTAILINRNISHFHVPTPPLRTGVEATLVALTPNDQEPFMVASIYIPPNPTYRNLSADLDTLFKIFNTAIVAGDYNAKHTSWGCGSSDPRGNYLLRYITNNNLDLIAPPTPTRYGYRSASTIDYALIKNLNWPCTADSLAELSSDHNPIRFYFPRTPKFEIPPPQLNTTWSIFTKILTNPENFDLPVANSTQEIDDQVTNLTTEILNAHASASRPFYQTERPYVKGELKGLIKERNKARKTWQQTRHPQHKTELNRLQNIIKRKIYHYRQQAWEDNLLTLNAEDNSLWGIAKAFRKKASPISALNGPTGIALSDTNKTEVIAQSLESQFQLNDIHNPHKDEVITSVVDAYLDSNTNNNDLIPFTLPSEIIQIIKMIKIKKCPGRDGITNKMIKKLPKLTIFKITNIVNNMLTLRYFPKSWKTAVVVPILKPGKNSALAESYRPISLLPVLSKLAEKIILARLNDYLEREKNPDSGAARVPPSSLHFPPTSQSR
ncbi:probable RNA-directed DNA polymerase from transposon X-element [Trichonephila clavipes]|nr:probable RNA-directed DNA polymerase from transposon X-element [Trichonephila clavipes]